nr:flagellar hook-associated protein FlgL [Vibrio stylophorae]
MSSRIASFHNYQSVANDTMRQQVKVAHNQEQLATGKRVNTAADDPVASISIQNFHQQQVELKQYQDTINLARNRLTREETAVNEIEQIADEAKRRVMLMINGSLSADDREAHRQDLHSNFEALLEVANIRDESGNYLFSGTLVSNRPFFVDRDNQVTYTGDSSQRYAIVAPSVKVQTSDAGDRVFMEVENPYGDYSPSYDLKMGSTVQLASALNSNGADNASYQVRFVQGATGLNYELSQDGKVVNTAAYNAKTGIDWNGMALRFEGDIKDGDTIALKRQETVNIFDSFKRGLKLANAPVSDASATAELNKVAEEFSASFKHFNRVRSELGTRLKTLDRQDSMHQDFNLELEKARGTLEDLDYSSAVIDLNENMMALKASQQAFQKTKQLSLFNYI